MHYSKTWKMDHLDLEYYDKYYSIHKYMFGLQAKSPLIQDILDHYDLENKSAYFFLSPIKSVDTYKLHNKILNFVFEPTLK
jgi:hypothetical protein